VPTGHILAPIASSAPSRWLQAAACFQEAAEAEPASLKALGNWGNALLEHGKVRRFHNFSVLEFSIISVCPAYYD
jgi:hypothetical protein